MVDAELTHGMVCHFEGSKHTLLLTHDSVVSNGRCMIAIAERGCMHVLWQISADLVNTRTLTVEAIISFC